MSKPSTDAPPELLPCPFKHTVSQGSLATDYDPYPTDGFDEDSRWCVYCPVCHSGSGFYNTEQEAIEAWQKRRASLAPAPPWQAVIDAVFDVNNENDLNDGGFFEAGFIAAKTKILDALIERRDAAPAPQGETVNGLIVTLRTQAAEIAKAGHTGWGNTMTWAADVLERRTATPSASQEIDPRWNLEQRDDGIYFCRGTHHRSHDCKWERLTVEIIQSALTPAPDKREVARRAAEKIADAHRSGQFGNDLTTREFVVAKVALIIEAELRGE